MSEAAGIHRHPTFKTGLIPTDPAKPLLELDKVLTGKLPGTPAADDHFNGATFGLYGNDKFGDCGPTSVCNLVRLVSKGLTGAQVTPSQADCYTLYKQSGNPRFDPSKEGGVEDNGVEMGTMLDALLKYGVGGVKPVAFGRSKATDDATLAKLVAIFGGCLWAVNLLEAQQTQTEAAPPRWDYRASGEWGGHAILDGKYEPDRPSGQDFEVISWQIDVETTEAFRAKQLEEAFCVVFPWHLEHPAFLEGVDQGLLGEAFHGLTGKTLPTPTPTPTPAPVEHEAAAADEALYTSTVEWSEAKHGGANKQAATAVRTWASAKGLATTKGTLMPQIKHGVGTWLGIISSIALILKPAAEQLIALVENTAVHWTTGENTSLIAGAAVAATVVLSKAAQAIAAIVANPGAGGKV